ncbi:MAG: hypothetical protein F6K19_13305 [Cyanothece sp. SIO1E1]|nr:hypothetical protein [Cyanothece sp. SIO1E1]
MSTTELSKVKRHISKDETPIALKVLVDYCKQYSTSKNRLACNLLENSLSNHKKAVQNGIIDNSEIKVSINRINHDILTLVSRIEDNSDVELLVEKGLRKTKQVKVARNSIFLLMLLLPFIYTFLIPTSTNQSLITLGVFIQRFLVDYTVLFGIIILYNKYSGFRNSLIYLITKTPKWSITLSLFILILFSTYSYLKIRNLVYETGPLSVSALSKEGKYELALKRALYVKKRERWAKLGIKFTNIERSINIAKLQAPLELSFERLMSKGSSPINRLDACLFGMYIDPKNPLYLEELSRISRLLDQEVNALGNEPFEDLSFSRELNLTQKILTGNQHTWTDQLIPVDIKHINDLQNTLGDKLLLADTVASIPMLRNWIGITRHIEEYVTNF